MEGRGTGYFLKVHLIIWFTFFLICYASSQGYIHCEEGFVKCNSTGKCILPEWQCDWEDDCGDCEDESDCRLMYFLSRANRLCSSREYFCSQLDRCIPESSICDGNTDCGNCFDEIRCSGDVTDTEPNGRCNEPNGFYCTHSRTCIERSTVCDGVNDCGDWDDERRCGYRRRTTTTETTAATIARTDIKQRPTTWFTQGQTSTTTGFTSPEGETLEGPTVAPNIQKTNTDNDKCVSDGECHLSNNSRPTAKNLTKNTLASFEHQFPNWWLVIGLSIIVVFMVIPITIFLLWDKWHKRRNNSFAFIRIDKSNEDSVVMLQKNLSFK